MKKLSLAQRGFLHAFGVLLYIFGVAAFMTKANSWFGETDQDFVTPVAVLMLFVFSALVTSGLVLGKPIMLYLDGQKKESIKLLLYTGLGIFILMAFVFFILLLMK